MMLCKNTNMDNKRDDLNLVYTLDGKIYINLTNLCSNKCVFCIRNSVDEIEGRNLWLKDEKFEASDVISQFEEVINDNPSAKEVVYCGFGEPLIKHEMLIQSAKYIKEYYPNIKIRINTNGQANLISKKNLIPEIKPYIDSISVSLNAENKEKYNKISNPSDKENSYDEVKEFIKECSAAGIDTIATVVSGFPDCDIDISECEKVCNSLGAKFRVREWLPNGY